MQVASAYGFAKARFATDFECFSLARISSSYPKPLQTRRTFEKQKECDPRMVRNSLAFVVTS